LFTEWLISEFFFFFQAFTVEGLELIRVSVVNFDGKLVYDALVKPEGKVLDYNTRYVD